MRFVKYHGLGNDYIVLQKSDLPSNSDLPSIARAICDRHRGVGSDGILVDVTPDDAGGDFDLRIFNPDGSVAEKSGNGLRIFARRLFDAGRVGAQPFVVHTLGGDVTCRVLSDGEAVVVDMGRVAVGEVELLALGDATLRVCAVSLGNPHCVVLRDSVSEAEARALGPLIEHHARFPNRTNVQFMQPQNRASIRIEIWERGAGYTLASGSSSCAAAAVARTLGWCDDDVAVHMPGGQLRVELDAQLNARLTGPVAKVCDGVFYAP